MWREEYDRLLKKHFILREQMQELRAALESAPRPTHHVDDYTDLWFVDEAAYTLWYNGQRRAALGVVNVGQMSGLE